jgi:hypothetical protein
VKENHFEVTLTFRKIPATLAIPFHALTAFVDPGVQFGLQFQPKAPTAVGAEAAAPPTALPPEKVPARRGGQACGKACGARRSGESRFLPQEVNPRLSPSENTP